jgi:hypothetical protein
VRVDVHAVEQRERDGAEEKKDRETATTHNSVILRACSHALTFRSATGEGS